MGPVARGTSLVEIEIFLPTFHLWGGEEGLEVDVTTSGQWVNLAGLHNEASRKT